MEGLICTLTFPDDEPSRVRSTAMVLARYYAKKAVKAEYQAKGIKLHQIESSKLNQQTLAYLDQHREELIAYATARYRCFVEWGYLQGPRTRRKPTQ